MKNDSTRPVPHPTSRRWDSPEKSSSEKRFSKMKYGVGVGSWAPCFAKRVVPGSASEQPHSAQSRRSSAAKSWSLLETFRGADMRRAWFAFMPTRFYSSSRPMRRTWTRVSLSWATGFRATKAPVCAGRQGSPMRWQSNRRHRARWASRPISPT